MDSIPQKQCAKKEECVNPLGSWLPATDEYFYKRPYTNSYNSECISCMKERSRNHKNSDYQTPRVASETVAINYLLDNYIPAIPGKALRHSHVDVIAFGCVKIEVKYSKLSTRGDVEFFTFDATPAQIRHGFRGHLVMLMCDYGDNVTHHIFKADNSVFYINGHIKSGMVYTVGLMTPKKHGNNRVVMLQPMMDAARDNVQLVHGFIPVGINELRQEL